MSEVRRLASVLGRHTPHVTLCGSVTSNTPRLESSVHVHGDVGLISMRHGMMLTANC